MARSWTWRQAGELRGARRILATILGIGFGCSLLFFRPGLGRASLAVIVEAEVEARLAESGTANVIIIVRVDKPEDLSRETYMQYVRQLQQRLLADLPAEMFHLRHRFEAIPVIAGTITRAGLEQLRTHPLVERIGLDSGGAAH